MSTKNMRTTNTIPTAKCKINKLVSFIALEDSAMQNVALLLIPPLTHSVYVYVYVYVECVYVEYATCGFAEGSQTIAGSQKCQSEPLSLNKNR